MADGNYEKGSMNIDQHRATWDAFTGMVFWGSVATAAVLVVMAATLL